MFFSSGLFITLASMAAFALQQDSAVCNGPDWIWVVTGAGGIASTISGMFIAGKLRIGSQVDQQFKDLKEAHAAQVLLLEARLTEKDKQSADTVRIINEASNTLVTSLKEQYGSRVEREVSGGSKWETFAQSLLDDLDTLNDNLKLSVNLAARTVAKGES